jgi:hypothetical protein
MRYRLASILAAESIATPATKTIDLTLKSKISRILLLLRLTGVGSTPTGHPALALPSIQVVDGSEVLWALSGRETLALASWNSGLTPMVDNIYLNGVQAIALFEINFGRYLYDPQLALDPAKHREPQIKITHDLTLGGCAPVAGSLQVDADVFDEAAATPAGFLMAKEHKSFNVVASAEEPTNLPTDYLLRSLMIMSHAAGYQPWQQYNNIKLDEDNDARVVFDAKTSALMKFIGGKLAPVRENCEGAATTSTTTFPIMSTMNVRPVGISMDLADAYIQGAYNYGGQLSIQASASTNFKALIEGQSPFGSLRIPFGNQQDPADWYDVSKIGTLRLKLTASSSILASSTTQIITEQLRKYAA